MKATSVEGHVSVGVKLGARPSKDRYHMQVAALTASMSTCSRLHVGCVLADLERETFVVGYNGGPKGGINECRRAEAGNCGCLHAEMNAVAKAPRGPKIAYLTDSPCEMCAVLLINAGVVRLHYMRAYRDRTGLEIMADAGIETSLL